MSSLDQISLFDLEPLTVAIAPPEPAAQSRATSRPATPQQISLLPTDPEPVGFTGLNEAARLKRQEAREALGSWWMLKLADGPSLTQPGNGVYSRTGAQLMVARIRDVLPKWGTATLECVTIAGDRLDVAEAAMNLLRNPDKFLKGRKVFTYPASEVWRDPPSEAVRKAKPVKLAQMTIARMEQLIWDWLLHGEKLSNPFARKNMVESLQERDRLVLNNSYDLAKKKLLEVAATLEQQVDENDFDASFWKLLELIATFGPDETVPANVHHNRVINPSTIAHL